MWLPRPLWLAVVVVGGSAQSVENGFFRASHRSACVRACVRSCVRSCARARAPERAAVVVLVAEAVSQNAHTAPRTFHNSLCKAVTKVLKCGANKCD